MDQLALFDETSGSASSPTSEDCPDLDTYDHFIVAFSGGKDSLACLLFLLEHGISREKIECWHHDVDGRDANGNPPHRGLMDWPCTPGYCRTVADALGVPLYFSWKVGGFEGELLREDEKTKAVGFEMPDGSIRTVGGDNGKKNTRRKFPQVSPSLSVRWCTPYVKIMVGAAALRHQKRFRGKRTLFITGERAEESASRKAYATFEPHRADLRDGQRYTRHIDHWRPVHSWTEDRVWDIIKRLRIKPHPAYRLGWGRVSCATCIFGSANQWASIREIAPERFERIAKLEEEFGVTIKRDCSIRELAAMGQPYDDINEELARKALDPEYDEPARVKEWSLPAGAFGESCGPV